MATDWSVEIVASTSAAADADLADRIIESLEGLGPVVVLGPGEGKVGVTMDVTGVTESDAFFTALRLLDELVPDLKLERMRLTSVESLERELADPSAVMQTLADLVGVAEVAEELGVSKQRVSQLVATGRFPVPAARLASGPLWTRHQIAGFQKRWRRLPGRPSRAAEEPIQRA